MRTNSSQSRISIKNMYNYIKDGLHRNICKVMMLKLQMNTFITIITLPLKKQPNSWDVYKARKLVLGIINYPVKDAMCPEVPTFSVHSSRCYEVWWKCPYCFDIVGIKMDRWLARLRVSDEELAWWRLGSIDAQGRFWQITFCLGHNSAFPGSTKKQILQNVVKRMIPIIFFCS